MMTMSSSILHLDQPQKMREASVTGKLNSDPAHHKRWKSIKFIHHKFYLGWNEDHTRSVCRSGVETEGGVSTTTWHRDRRTHPPTQILYYDVKDQTLHAWTHSADPGLLKTAFLIAMARASLSSTD